MPDAAAGVDQFDTYTYDANGGEVMRTMPDGSYTVYVEGLYEEHHAPGGAVDGVTKYYEIGGRTVAVRDALGALHFLLNDRLGTTTQMVDASGTVESTDRYWPYGAPRSSTGSPATDRLYTGQRQEPADPGGLGLYNYKARFYSTMLGRFVSADPTNGSGLDRYEYANDNPLRFNDPTGLGCFIVCPAGSDPLVVNPDGQQISGPPQVEAGCDANCRALRELDAVGIHSPDELNYRAALQYCDANPANCDGTPSSGSASANAPPSAAPMPVRAPSPSATPCSGNCGSTHNGGHSCGFFCDVASSAVDRGSSALHTVGHAVVTGAERAAHTATVVLPVIGRVANPFSECQKMALATVVTGAATIAVSTVMFTVAFGGEVIVGSTGIGAASAPVAIVVAGEGVVLFTAGAGATAGTGYTAFEACRSG